MRLLHLILLLLTATLEAVTTQPHHTTAFIGQPGELDTLISYSHYNTNHFWNKSGNLVPRYNHFYRQACTLYAEYAIWCADSVTFDGGYDFIRERLDGNTFGFEDFELGWKHQVYSTETAALTTQLIALIPGGKKRCSLRYARPGFQAGILYSDQYSRGWYDLGLGYRFYQGFPSDQIVAEGALGYDLLSCLQFVASIQLEYGLFNGQSNKNFNNIVFNPNYRLLNGKLELNYRLMKHVTFVAGGFQHLWGRNSGSGGGFFGGSWIDF